MINEKKLYYDIDFQVFSCNHDDIEDFKYTGHDSIEECKEYIANLPKGWGGRIEVICYNGKNPEVITYEEYKERIE